MLDLIGWRKQPTQVVDNFVEIFPIPPYKPNKIKHFDKLPAKVAANRIYINQQVSDEWVAKGRRKLIFQIWCAATDFLCISGSDLHKSA